MSEILQPAVGSLLGAALMARARRSEDARRRRRAAADHVYRSLLVLKGLMLRKDIGKDLEVWVEAVRSSYDALDEHEYTLPHQWRHLKRSMRYAIGEATCLGLIDLSTVEPSEAVAFNGTWLEFGGDYLEYVTRSVGRWRELYSERKANSAEIMDFDAWLARTGRYILGAGVWPEPDGRRRPHRV